MTIYAGQERIIIIISLINSTANKDKIKYLNEFIIFSLRLFSFHGPLSNILHVPRTIWLIYLVSRRLYQTVKYLYIGRVIQSTTTAGSWHLIFQVKNWKTGKMSRLTTDIFTSIWWSGSRNQLNKDLPISIFIPTHSKMRIHSNSQCFVVPSAYKM